MRQPLKIGATAVIVACAWLIVWRTVVLPYTCNIRLKSATDNLGATLSLSGNHTRAAEVARRTIVVLQPCVAACPDNVGAQMVLGASLRQLDRNREAIAAYETALQFDRRPELYLNLGQAQLGIGDSKSARKNFLLACLYFPAFLDEIGEYRPEILQAVQAYQARIAGTKR